MESKNEMAHQEAVEACRHRAEVVEKAIAKLIRYIEEHPENPVFADRPQRHFEILLPLTSDAE